MSGPFGPIPGGGPPTPESAPPPGAGFDSLFGGQPGQGDPVAALAGKIRDIQTQLLALAQNQQGMAPFVQKANDALTEGLVQVGASLPEQQPGTQPPTGGFGPPG